MEMVLLAISTLPLIISGGGLETLFFSPSRPHIVILREAKAKLQDLLILSLWILQLRAG
jgi:hypothetical protein